MNVCNYISYSKGNAPECQINHYPCPCFRYCNRANRYIIYDSPYITMDDCKIRKEYEQGNVLFEKHGDLYIKVNDSLNIALKNPYDYIPNNVELGQNEEGEYYIIK